jgi:hypothetical protein
MRWPWESCLLALTYRMCSDRVPVRLVRPTPGIPPKNGCMTYVVQWPVRWPRPSHAGSKSYIAGWINVRTRTCNYYARGIGDAAHAGRGFAASWASTRRPDGTLDRASRHTKRTGAQGLRRTASPKALTREFHVYSFSQPPPLGRLEALPLHTNTRHRQHAFRHRL